MHLLRSAVTALIFSALTASAATITYQATDIADSGAGDAWQYTYRVSDAQFAERQAFSILFDPNLFSDLAAISSPEGWDVLVLQPSLTLPASGRYEPLALTAGLPLGGVFTLSFVWHGAGAPGSQPFEIIRYDDDWNPTVTSAGVTMPEGEVPEPATWMMFAAGTGALAVARRRSRQTQ